uniref:NADH-ubiquinone oxidoreductase chain 4 n=1 Tax=Vulcanolepas fijiensis TaxID=2511776 RepID=A0A649YE43_9CRUS|nr:NADH dehydrogenase subunit 4 [Vulcanolepas fijiensis]QGL53218.1 NADH dehydrogenase subunit 4 [Vulcanolepas fijiensis]
MLKFLLLSVTMLIMSNILSFMSNFFYMILASIFWLLIYSEGKVTQIGFGFDTLSWFLILLTFWVIMFMFMASQMFEIDNYFKGKFSFVLILMFIFLFLTFSGLDLISFYIFFEGSLIPIYMLIMGWGYQPERLQAGIYLLLYTVFASLPLLISLFYLGKSMGGYSFVLLKSNFLFFNWVNLWFFFSIFAFLVKLPVFYFHLWLPKAHVEAPVSGSMMLAGVLLKLGCYGLMRLMPFFEGSVMCLSSMLLSLGLLGGLLVSFICLRQVDLKSLIAYSSVSHMGLALAGLGSWGLWGFSSCLYTCLAHGLCSSGLFFLSGVIYERSGSRSIFINKGMLLLMPSMSFWWFIYCIGNMAAPVVLNLVGEVGLLGSIMSFSSFTLIFLMAFSFMGACYSLFLFSSIQHGKVFTGINSLSDGVVREYLLLYLHFFPLFFLILEVDMMSF